MMGNPFVYPLCDQVVTVYGLLDGKLTRRVLENVYYAWEDIRQETQEGIRLDRRFLLIVPGACQQVFPGDRVFDGIGPEAVDWEAFLPATVPGLSQVDYARVWRWDGRIVHTEAGRK